MIRRFYESRGDFDYDFSPETNRVVEENLCRRLENSEKELQDLIEFLKKERVYKKLPYYIDRRLFSDRFDDAMRRIDQAKDIVKEMIDCIHL